MTTIALILFPVRHDARATPALTAFYCIESQRPVPHWLPVIVRRELAGRAFQDPYQLDAEQLRYARPVRDCILKGQGGQPCSGKVNQEHYLPKSVQKRLGRNNKIIVGGAPRQAPGRLELRGINTQTVGIYCEGHNSGMHDLDDTLLAFCDAVKRASLTPESASQVAKIHGELLELACLKVAVGTTAAKYDFKSVPPPWLKALAARTLEESWGLYVRPDQGWKPVDEALHIELAMLQFPEGATGAALAIPFGVHLHLGPCSLTIDLGSPEFVGANGYYRGAGWRLQNGRFNRSIALEWPGRAPTHWVGYRCSGPTGVVSPLRARWGASPEQK